MKPDRKMKPDRSKQLVVFTMRTLVLVAALVAIYFVGFELGKRETHTKVIDYFKRKEPKKAEPELAEPVADPSDPFANVGVDFDDNPFD